MKRFLISLCALGCAVSLSANVGIEHGGGGGGGSVSVGHGGVGRSNGGRSHVIIKMHRRNMPRPNVIQNPRNAVRDQRTAVVPERDENGAMIHERATVIAPQHTTIVRNSAVIRGIRQQQRVEIVPNHYYWHTVGGIRYSHYYDHGTHWYGFYHGPTFYWTRYYGNRWWWFDGGFNRWVYWWDGDWWWPAVGGGLYVYVDNNYYPYGGRRRDGAENRSPNGSGNHAGDGDRGHRFKKSGWKTSCASVRQNQAEAFLYDTSSGQPMFMKYLGQGVKKFVFSGGGTYGKPSRGFSLDFTDGNFALYNEDGDSLDAAAPDATAGDDAALPTAPPPGPTAPSNNAPPPAPTSTPQQ